MAFTADGKSHLSSKLAVPKVKSQRAGIWEFKSEEQVALEKQMTPRVGSQGGKKQRGVKGGCGQRGGMARVSTDISLTSTVHGSSAWFVFPVLMQSKMSGTA